MWRSLKTRLRRKSHSRSRASDEHLGLNPVNTDSVAGNNTSERTYEIDIVAIHGLNGTAIGTWTKESEDSLTGRKISSCWLKDFLPNDIPGARIFTYGYPAQVLFSKSKEDISEFAQKLLLALKDVRHNQKHRPLVFLTHSLGGIVCKQAMISAKEDPGFNDILESTAGILFFGTPHSGAINTPELAIILSNLVDAASKASMIRPFKGKSRTDLLENLKANSVTLRRITLSFSFVYDSFKIVTIYETQEQEPLGRLIVNQDSAIMGFKGERRIPRNASHTEMCRFAASSDPDYRLIRRELQDLCEEACYSPTLEDSEKACIKIFNDPGVNAYRSTLPEPTSGTCEWISKDSTFDCWVNEQKTSLLWISGHPGCGKTILASYITNQFESEARKSRGARIVSYFFCNDGIENQRDARAILRSLIFQILLERRNLIKQVKKAISYDKEDSHVLDSYERLWSIFSDIICNDQSGSVVIVIDALDECEMSSRDRWLSNIAKIIDHLRLFSSRCIKFILTSRPHLAIADCFSNYEPQYLPLEENQKEIDGDLQLVIAQRVKQIAKKVAFPEDEAMELNAKLFDKADRTFLWAKFALDILDEELDSSPGDFHRILAELPRDLEATYERFLRNVKPGKEDFAASVLRAITASVEPLSLEEINISVSLSKAVNEGCHSLVKLRQQYLRNNIRNDIHTALGPLIRVSDSKVYLVHISLKEFLCDSVRHCSNQFLANRYHVNIREADLSLASSCMHFLALDDFSRDMYVPTESSESASSPIDSSKPSHSSHSSNVDKSGLPAEDSEDNMMIDNLFEERTDIENQISLDLAKRYVFFQYSASYWTKHFAESQLLADSDLRDLAWRLIDEAPLYQNWSRFFWYKTSALSVDPLAFDEVITAAFFDHFVILERILQSDHSIQRESLATGICWAAHNGNVKSLNILLRNGAHPEDKTIASQSALCSAAEQGHLEAVEALLADHRVNVNFKGSRGGTPLSFAAGAGQLGIVDYLLRNEHSKIIEVDVKDIKGETPLFWAIDGGHTSTTSILVADDRVDVNHVNYRNETPFNRAAWGGNVDIVNLFLRLPTVDIQSPSIDGRTPLANAAAAGNTQVIKALKHAKRLDITHSHKDSLGRNAFALAAHHGHDEVIKCLLKYRMPGIDEEDDDQWTPLFWALESPRDSTVATLLKSGRIDVNHRDHSGRTALSWIVSYGNMAILSLLLGAKGINPLTKDQDGLTSLDHARQRQGQEHILYILEDFVQKQD